MGNPLTEQIGPLPGGAWLAVVAGGLGIGVLGRRRKGPKAAPAAVAADTAQWQSSQGAVQYVGPGTGVTSMGTPKAATNEEWAANALGYLIGRGAVASRATNAISHVLYPDAANPTSPEDSAIYNMAVAGVGAPPQLPAQAFIPDAPAVGMGHPAGIAQTLGNLSIAGPGRYQLERQAGGTGKLFGSVGGAYTDASGYSAVGGIPLDRAYNWFLAKVAGPGAGSATISYVDPATGLPATVAAR